MDGYYQKTEVQGPLSHYVRSFHIADNDVSQLKIQSPPTGYPLLAHIWRGLEAIEVDGELLPPLPLPINLFAGQLQKVQATISWSNGMGHAVVEFTATGLYELFGIPGDHIVNAAFPVAALNPQFDARMTTELQRAPSDMSYFQAFGNVLTELIDSASVAPDYIAEAVRLIEAESGAIKLSDVINQISVGERMFNKKFKEIVGLPPKYFCRVVQFNNVGAIVLSGEDAPIGRLAADAGFYDQSHFTKAFHEFVLSSPSRFLHGDFSHVSTFLRHLSGGKIS